MVLFPSLTRKYQQEEVRSQERTQEVKAKFGDKKTLIILFPKWFARKTSSSSRQNELGKATNLLKNE